MALRPLETAQLRRGDLVAIRWGEGLHVKRVAGLPGDTIGLDGLRLMVNGDRLEDRLRTRQPSIDLPEFLVDHDSHRESSRWTAAADSHWKRMPDRTWSCTASRQDDWLVYQHRSVHDHQQVSQVWDDYPFNVTLQRKMHGVDRFIVRGRLKCVTPTTLEIALWSTVESRLAVVHTSEDQDFAMSFFDSEVSDQLPVSPETPIAIRLRSGAATISDLAIHRLIEYRLRPRDERSRYPLEVNEGECFVLGDNVPVSVDSRDLGLLPISSIDGVIDPVSAAHPHALTETGQ